MSLVTVQQLIDQARIRHWSFANLEVGDGAALLFLNERQRVHLGRHGAQIEGLVGTSLEYDLANSGALLVAMAGGVPVYTTTYQDGWPVHLDAGGVPYIDTTEPQIAADPFGQHGGTPGFPLPADFVRLINVMLVYNQPPGLILPCDIVDERQRNYALPGRNPTAFVSGNRLVPMLAMSPGSANTADRWFSVSSIQLSYVAIQILTALTDAVMLPAVLVAALVADLAVMMAMASKACPATDRAALAADAAAVAASIAAVSEDMLGSPMQSSVIYKG